MKEYYYIDKNNLQQGPVSPTLFPQLGVTHTTLVWSVGMDQWLPAGDIPELAPYISVYINQNPNNFSGQPNYGYGQNGVGNNMPQLPPPSNLVWAILTTLFCCLPFGIVSIVYASQVDSEWNMGRYAEAQRKSRAARTWAIVSAAVGLLFAAIYFFCVFAMAIF